MTPDSFLKKFKIHSDAKKALSDYFTAFHVSAEKSDPASSQTSLGFSLGSAGWINNSEEMVAASQQFSQFLTKMLGARFGDEKDFADLIRKAAHDAISKNMPETDFIASVAAKIAETLSQDFEIFLPNRLVYLGPKITPLKVGNVRLLKLTDLEKEILPMSNAS